MTAPDGLPPLRDIIRRFDLLARKSLGQNFLLDLNLTGRIARAAAPLAGITVVEIGPGPGGLTRALLTEGAKRVIAIERDTRAVAALAGLAAACPGQLDVIEDDALTFDPRNRIDGAARIVANLPYNIATPLLVGWLGVEPWPPWFDMMVLMFQREVAQRIAAQSGNKNYGRLSVLAQWRCEVKLLFDVPPSAFVPPPKVTSSVVRLTPRTQPLPCNRATLERVTQAAFGQRRKMLRQSLKSLTPKVIEWLEAVEIDPTARGEEIPVAGFVALANALARFA